MESLSLPEDVKSQLERFEAAVASVETGLAPILALDRRELEAALTPLERAKVHVSMANAVSTLFSMYLKAVGLDPADHAVKRELERVALVPQLGGSPDAAVADVGRPRSHAGLAVRHAPSRRFKPLPWQRFRAFKSTPARWRTSVGVQQIRLPQI